MKFDLKGSLKAFFVGGGVIGSSKYISTKVSSVWAALIGGAPQGIISAFFIPETKVKDFFRGYIIQSIVLTILISVLNAVIIYTSIDINLLTVITLIVWAIISVIMIRRSKKKEGKKKANSKK